MKPIIRILQSTIVCIFLLLSQFSLGQDYSLLFDGVDDVVIVNKYDKLNLGSNNFTIEALLTLKPKSRDVHTILTNSTLNGGGIYWV